MASIVEAASTLELSAHGKARSTVQGSPLGPEELRKTHAYWRAQEEWAIAAECCKLAHAASAVGTGN